MQALHAFQTFKNMKLPLTIEPNPILRAHNRLIKKEELPALQKTLDDMIDSMYAYNGIGIAATQVGLNIMAAIIHKDALDFKNKKLHGAFHGADFLILNPKITSHSWGILSDEEGCLSVPGYHGIVKRYKKITVSCMDRKGTPLTFVAHGFFARVLQHEIDHLNGTLYIDKATDSTPTKT